MGSVRVPGSVFPQMGMWRGSAHVSDDHHLAVKVPGSVFPQMGMWMGSVHVNNDHFLSRPRRDSVAQMETVSDHVALATSGLVVRDRLTMPIVGDGRKFVTVWRKPHDLCDDNFTRGPCVMHGALRWKHVVVSKMGTNK